MENSAMNVYDFDGTIYYPNSFADFAVWYMNRHPALWVKFFPKAMWNVFLCGNGKKPLYTMLRDVFSLLRMIDDIDMQIERFWDEHEKKISPWYLDQKRPDDLIISASPSCIIGPIAKRLGVKYVATEYDVESGVFVGDLMFARGKSRYIIDNDFPVINNFYSDSLSDTPIALCAEKAHMVTEKAQKVVDWPHLDDETMKKVHKKINTGWTIHL